jgi:subtilisin family serine protease
VYFAECTGKGVRVAVIDSGVHATHPHVRGVAGGIAIREDGTLHEDYVDRLGHGTAVTAAIREKAPDAEILAIKVFWRALSTDIGALVRAIDEAAARGAAVINLSLGTSNTQHRPVLEDAAARARARGALIVAANDDGGVRWLPGCLDEVVAVRADWGGDRDAYRVGFVEDRPMLSTSPYPRDIPGVSRDRNVNGVSFAVANASGFVARALEAIRRMPGPPAADLARVFAALDEACPEHADHPSTLRRALPGRGTTGSG